MKVEDITAIAAICIAVVIPGVQAIFARRREWHDAQEFLLGSISSLFDEINSLVKSPGKTNHTAFQYFLRERMVLLDLFRKRFILQQRRIDKVKSTITEHLMDLPKNIEYERVIMQGEKDRVFFYQQFCEELRKHILDASETLIK